MANQRPVEQIHEYASRRGLIIRQRLGFGVHGSVFAAEHQSNHDLVAVKAVEREDCYIRERDVYLRLRELGIRSVHGCRIPLLIEFDDELQILEMSIVARPYVLDFGGAYLDHAPDFPDEAVAEWHAEKKEQFGRRWGDVQIILATLARHGIHVVDVNPNNISWGD